MELGEFDIRYKPRPALKAQVLVDFMAEMTQPPTIEDDQLACKLFREGSTCRPSVSSKVKLDKNPVI